jgi:hypothetical protein
VSGTGLWVTTNTAEAEWCAIRLGDDEGVKETKDQKIAAFGSAYIEFV